MPAPDHLHELEPKRIEQVVVGDVEMLVEHQVAKGFIFYRQPGPCLIVFPGMKKSINEQEDEEKETEEGVDAFHGSH
jgi:hypothetical protein